MDTLQLVLTLWIQVDMGVIKELYVSATESLLVYIKLKLNDELTVSILSLHTHG